MLPRPAPDSPDPLLTPATSSRCSRGPLPTFPRPARRVISAFFRADSTQTAGNRPPPTSKQYSGGDRGAARPSRRSAKMATAVWRRRRRSGDSAGGLVSTARSNAAPPPPPAMLAGRRRMWVRRAAGAPSPLCLAGVVGNACRLSARSGCAPRPPRPPRPRGTSFCRPAYRANIFVPRVCSMSYRDTDRTSYAAKLIS